MFRPAHHLQDAKGCLLHLDNAISYYLSCLSMPIRSPIHPIVQFHTPYLAKVHGGDISLLISRGKCLINEVQFMLRVGQWYTQYSLNSRPPPLLHLRKTWSGLPGGRATPECAHSSTQTRLLHLSGCPDPAASLLDTELSRPALLECPAP